MEILSILCLIFIILFIISILFVIGLSRLTKIPLKFPYFFYSYDKERIALNDELKTKLKSLKFQFLNGGAKESQLTKMHAKLRKSNNPNLNIFASDTQKIIDDNMDDNLSDYDLKANDSLKSTSLSFAFTSSTSGSDFTKVFHNNELKSNKLNNKNAKNIANYNTTAINMDNISIPNSIPTLYDDNSTLGDASNFSLNSKN